MVTIALDELEASAGQHLGASEWRTIGQERIDTFAELTEDQQWIHVDVDRAATGPFGTTIAHGYLTMSLVSAFIAEIFDVTGTGSALNYGLDRLRFITPVPAGSRIRGVGEVLTAVPVPGGVQTTVRVTVEIEGFERPAAVADVITRFLA